jgi:hypothetical protein
MVEQSAEDLPVARPAKQPRALRSVQVKRETPTRFHELLSVNSVLELGYALHVTNDQKAANSKAAITARQLIEEFQSWHAPTGSPDHIYLFQMRQLVLKLGQGITRRKQTFLNETEAADHERAQQLARLNTARNDDFWFAFWGKAATTAGVMAVAAAIGFALAESLLPFAPVRTEHQQDALNAAGYWPGILVAGVFAAITRNVSKWLSQQNLEKIFAHCEMAHRQAWWRYQKGKLAEYEHTEGEIRRLFFEYTGYKAPRCLSYSAIINEELDTDRSITRERAKLSENLLVRTLARFRRMRRAHFRRIRRNGTNGPTIA